MTEIVAAGRLDNEVLRKRAEACLLIDPDAGLCAVVVVHEGHRSPHPQQILEIVRTEVASAGDGDAPALVAALRSADMWLRSKQEIGVIACIAAALFRRGHVHVAHVGSLRVYRWRRGAIEQLTRDHTIAADPEALRQALDSSGSTEIDMVSIFRRILTQALGHGDVAPSVATHALEPGDRFVLCSIDPDWDSTDADLAAALAERSDAAFVCDRFVDLARERGVATVEGRRPLFNVAVVVADVKLP